MGLIDLLGSPAHQLFTRLTDKELTHLDDYKKRYETKYKENPSSSKILRIALMEYLERMLKTL